MPIPFAYGYVSILGVHFGRQREEIRIKHGSYRIGASVARTTVWMQEAVYHAGVKLLSRLGFTG